MKRSVLCFFLLGLAACAPRAEPQWVVPPGRQLAIDQSECRRRARIAIPYTPATPYTPLPPTTSYRSPYTELGNALGNDLTRLGQEMAQRDLYVITCLEAFGYRQKL